MNWDNREQIESDPLEAGIFIKQAVARDCPPGHDGGQSMMSMKRRWRPSQDLITTFISSRPDLDHVFSGHSSEGGKRKVAHDPLTANFHLTEAWSQPGSGRPPALHPRVLCRAHNTRDPTSGSSSG